MIYNYREAVKADIKEYIKANISLKDYPSLKALEEHLEDVLATKDDVTGNGCGSYTLNRYQAEEYLSHNLDLFKEAAGYFGMDAMQELADPEGMDVLIRCYVLDECISTVLEGMQEEFEKAHTKKRRLHISMAYTFVGDTEIEVPETVLTNKPEDEQLKAAYEYAMDHIDEIPVAANAEYIPGSDRFEEEDINFVMDEEDDIVHEDERLASFVTDSNVYVLHYFIIPKDTDIDHADIAGCIEDTLHRLIDAGKDDLYIADMLGAVKITEDNPYNEEKDTYIDLDYFIKGHLYNIHLPNDNGTDIAEAVVKDYADTIMESFEFLLDSKGIDIPSEDRTGDLGEARIYGMEYGMLEDEVLKWLNEYLDDKEESINLYVNNILDAFENLLKEKDRKGEPDEARLYGMEYTMLEEKINCLLSDLWKEAIWA